MEELLKSVYESQDEILNAIVRLHVPDGIECDMTYGNGGFWKTLKKPKHCFDLSPLGAGVKKADSRKLPLPDASLRSAAFDPPFLCYMRDGRSSSKRRKDLARTSSSIMSNRFGGYWAYPELASHYKETLAEAARVLVKKGFFVIKCQDIIALVSLHFTSMPLESPKVLLAPCDPSNHSLKFPIPPHPRRLKQGGISIHLP